jgi:hypothetical protein
MSGKYRLQKQTKKLNVSKQDEVLYIPGSLGITISGSKTVEVPDRPGFVYVRLRNDLSETVKAYNDKVAPVYDLPVILVRDKTNKNYYTIFGKDTGVYTNWSTTSYLPRHGAAHSFDPNSPGADIVWTYDNQIMQFAAVPSGSSGGMNLIIEPGVFYSERYDRWIYCCGTGTASLSTYLPTGTQQRSVLCYVDWNGNPKLSGGSYFAVGITGTSSVLGTLPIMPADIEIPVCAVRLMSGTSYLSWDNIYNLRQFPEGYNLGTVGGSSGLSSGTLAANVIPYATDSGLFPTWNTDFTIDDKSGGGLNLVLNGTRSIPAPVCNFNMVSESGQGDSLALWGFGRTQTIKFARSGGSQASQTALVSGTIIGAIDILTYTGSYYNYTAGIYFNALEDQSNTKGGTKIDFYATNFGDPYYGFDAVLSLHGNKAYVSNYLWVGSGTNYVTLDGLNGLRLYGNATVFDDLTFDLTSGKQGALDKPDFNYTEGGYAFPQNDTDEILYLTKQMPHNWKEGSTVEPHLHFRQTSSSWPVFKIDYRWYNVGDVIPAGWTTLTFDTPIVSYVTGTIHQIADSSGTVSGVGKTVSSMFQVKLYRDDNVVTGDVVALQFDLHYEIDSLGSRDEYVK